MNASIVASTVVTPKTLRAADYIFYVMSNADLEELRRLNDSRSRLLARLAQINEREKQILLRSHA